MQTKLILFSGLPGTGKSTFASRLARELQMSLLCTDDVVGEVLARAGIEFWDSKVAILFHLQVKLRPLPDLPLVERKYHA